MTNLRHYEESYLPCRGIDGHSWHRTADDLSLLRDWQASRSVYRVARACDCGCYQVKAYHRATMDAITTGRRYPKGYKATREDRPSDFRLEQVRRESRRAKVTPIRRTGRKAS